MKERFDPKSEDIYLWLSHLEIQEADSITYGFAFERLINDQTKVVFLVDRVPNGVIAPFYLDVAPIYDQGKNHDYTLFHIRISEQAWKDLKQNKFATTRYHGPIGAEKIYILAGDPDIEGLDALRR